MHLPPSPSRSRDDAMRSLSAGCRREHLRARRQSCAHTKGDFPSLFGDDHLAWDACSLRDAHAAAALQNRTRSEIHPHQSSLTTAKSEIRVRSIAPHDASTVRRACATPSAHKRHARYGGDFSTTPCPTGAPPVHPRHDDECALFVTSNHITARNLDIRRQMPTATRTQLPSAPRSDLAKARWPCRT